MANANGEYALNQHGIVSHSQEWFGWADANGVEYQRFNSLLDAYRAFWRGIFPSWANEQVEQAARASAWTFAE